MRILALETSTPTIGVALLDGDELVGVRSDEVGAGASARILPWAEDLLNVAGWGPRDLDAVAVSIGPGSFTGLRVGLSTAKSLAWSAEIALVGESSLRTLAASAVNPSAGAVSAVIDARREQVYAAVFQGPDLQRVTDDVVADPADWAAELARRSPIEAVGDGLARYADAFGEGHLAVRPEAEHLARLAVGALAAGRTLDPRNAVPNYVRSHGAAPPKDMRG